MKTLETLFCGQADAVLLSKTFAGIATTFATLAALSFAFGETPMQVTLFFAVALVSMFFACAGFPFRAQAAPDSVSAVNDDVDLERLAYSVGVLTPAR